MQLNRCFTRSQGKLGCLTCHDPHEQPAVAAAPAYFRSKCLTCHNDGSCRLSQRQREPEDNRIGCHMPRRSAGAIAHSALTDHRIPARPGQKPAGNLPANGGIRGVRVVDAREGAGELPLLTRLELLGSLRDLQLSLGPQYAAAVEEAARQHPEDPLVLAVLGRAALRAQRDDAADILTRAEKTEASKRGVARASTYTDLGDAYLQGGRAAYPSSKDIRKRLVLACIRGKDFVKASATLREYVADFPEDSFMRGLLAQAGGGR